ncbi:hypothetical protein [Chiayiivirga flava]|uniref:DUF3124 domain-containing protein n=1 Tax=Chiayiivirga flava TaxID=659595 RepID=A0A7W8FZH0_9GAMM|nr:hypothetical protein [Chiayiivirga flava]MBB5208116.1 hypothetical protein [Chiayiivirga flava]
MKSFLFRSIIFVVLLSACNISFADSNFPDRKALVLNTCPFVELSEFSFANRYSDRSTRFLQNLSWKNVGEQPIVAFEIVILKYDPFNRRQIGTKWTVTGVDSANWRPLAVGEIGKDGTLSYGDEEVFTSIAYVRHARLADGTIWSVDDAELSAKLRGLGTGISDFGDVKPDPKPKQL